jgi:predicted  nucleic acid-binding Zn-ribbon protein
MAKQYSDAQLNALNSLKEWAKFLEDHRVLLDHLVSKKSSLEFKIRDLKDELWDTKERISHERKHARGLKKEFRQKVKEHKLTTIDLAMNDIPFQGVL